jgi:hypothetical protein
VADGTALSYMAVGLPRGNGKCVPKNPALAARDGSML